MARDFDHEDGFIQHCPDCERLEKKVSRLEDIVGQFVLQHAPCDCAGCQLYERMKKGK